MYSFIKFICFLIFTVLNTLVFILFPQLVNILIACIIIRCRWRSWWTNIIYLSTYFILLFTLFWIIIPKFITIFNTIDKIGIIFIWIEITTFITEINKLTNRIVLFICLIFSIKLITRLRLTLICVL